MSTEEQKLLTLREKVKRFLAALEDAKNNRAVSSKQLKAKKLQQEVEEEMKDRPVRDQPTLDFWAK